MARWWGPRWMGRWSGNRWMGRLAGLRCRTGVRMGRRRAGRAPGSRAPVGPWEARRPGHGRCWVALRSGGRRSAGLTSASEARRPGHGRCSAAEPGRVRPQPTDRAPGRDRSHPVAVAVPGRRPRRSSGPARIPGTIRMGRRSATRTAVGRTAAAPGAWPEPEPEPLRRLTGAVAAGAVGHPAEAQRAETAPAAPAPRMAKAPAPRKAGSTRTRPEATQAPPPTEGPGRGWAPAPRRTRAPFRPGAGRVVRLARARSRHLRRCRPGGAARTSFAASWWSHRRRKLRGPGMRCITQTYLAEQGRGEPASRRTDAPVPGRTGPGRLG
jgi:hypothetical protein